MNIDEAVKPYFGNAIPLKVAETLPTKRLLAFYKKYRWIQLSLDYGSEQPIIDYFNKIKEILNSREHVVK